MKRKEKIVKTLKFNGTIIPDALGPVYDFIKRSNVTPKAMTDFLENAKGEDVLLSMSSGGGEITAASDMYTALKKYPGKVNVEITGNSASAATIVMLGADHVAISPSASVMIHNVQSGAQGDYRDLGNVAGASKNLSEGFAEMYAQKMNKSIDEVKELMDATTWYNAKQAKEAGLVDEIMFESAPMMVASDDLLLSDEAVSKINALMQNHKEPTMNIEFNPEQMKQLTNMIDEKIAAVKAEFEVKNSADKPLKNQKFKPMFGGIK